MHSSTLFVLSSLFVSGVWSHAALTQVTGANGVTKNGLGVKKTTGLTQADAIRPGNGASACGQGINIASDLTAASGATAGADGSVTMTVFQINADGNPPFTCGVSADASGSSFTAMTVTQQSQNKVNSASTMVATLPAGTTCTGAGNTCLVQCKNKTGFGGCVAVSTSAGGATGGAAAAAGGNNTDAAAATGNNKGGNVAAAGGNKQQGQAQGQQQKQGGQGNNAAKAQQGGNRQQGQGQGQGQKKQVGQRFHKKARKNHGPKRVAH